MGEQWLTEEPPVGHFLGTETAQSDFDRGDPDGGKKYPEW